MLRVDIRTCTAIQVLQIIWNCKYQFDKLKSRDNNAYPNSNFIISPLNPIWWRSLELSLWDDWTVIIYSVWLRNNCYFPLNFKCAPYLEPCIFSSYICMGESFGRQCILHYIYSQTSMSRTSMSRSSRCVDVFPKSRHVSLYNLLKISCMSRTFMSRFIR